MTILWYGFAGSALVSNMLFNVPVIERINSGELRDQMGRNGSGWDGMFGGNSVRVGLKDCLAV